MITHCKAYERFLIFPVAIMFSCVTVLLLLNNKGINNMLKPTTVYNLVIDGIITAEGSAKKMHQLRKKQGGIVYLAPNRKIGERME